MSHVHSTWNEFQSYQKFEGLFEEHEDPMLFTEEAKKNVIFLDCYCFPSHIFETMWFNESPEKPRERALTLL